MTVNDIITSEHIRWLRVVCEGAESASCTCADEQACRDHPGCRGRWESAERVAEEVAIRAVTAPSAPLIAQTGVADLVQRLRTKADEFARGRADVPQEYGLLHQAADTLVLLDLTLHRIITGQIPIRAVTVPLSEMVRVMCPRAGRECECAAKGQYQDFDSCRLVYRHANALLDHFARNSPVSDVEQRLRTALEELIGAAEHCGDGDVLVVIKARAALASGQPTEGER